MRLRNRQWNRVITDINWLIILKYNFEKTAQIIFDFFVKTNNSDSYYKVDPRFGQAVWMIKTHLISRIKSTIANNIAMMAMIKNIAKKLWFINSLNKNGNQIWNKKCKVQIKR